MPSAVAELQRKGSFIYHLWFNAAFSILSSVKGRILFEKKSDTANKLNSIGCLGYKFSAISSSLEILEIFPCLAALR